MDKAQTDRPWRSELRSMLALAGPVVTVQVGQMTMGLVDTMMLGRYSKEALAAGALANVLSFGVLALPMGLLMALDPLVAQAWGARNLAAAGRHLRRGLITACYASVPVGLALWGIGSVVPWLRQQPEVAVLVSDYLLALIPGVPAFLVFLTLRRTLQAMSVVWPALVAVAAANLVNAVANYGLVFGNLGLPELGATGGGLATSLSRWVLLGSLALVGLPRYRDLWGRLSWSDFQLRSHLLLWRLGAPVSLQLALEFWVFGAIGLMMGTLGVAEFGGHQIALTLASMSFMVPVGIAGAAATRVGNALGRGELVAARRSAGVALGLAVAVMSVSALAFVSLPGLLARAFTPNLEVIAVAALLIPIAGAFQIADGLQVVAAGILRGAADTRWPAIIAFSGFWLLGIPLGATLAFQLGRGAAGLWWGLTAGLVVVALLLLWRVRGTFSRPIEELLAETT